MIRYARRSWWQKERYLAVLVIQRPAVAKVFYFEVADKYEYFHKQAKFGLHMPLVFGDHIEECQNAW